VKELTDRQAQVLEYIVKYRHERGIPPTYREIARHFGVTVSAIYQSIDLISKKGMVNREKHRARSIQAR
jgi:repressor LexA